MTTLLDRLSVLGCILLILGGPAGGLIASAAEGAPDRGLRAGAAAADITPPLGSKRCDVTLKLRKPDEKMQEYFAGVMAKPEDAPKYHRRERNYAGRVQRLLGGPDEVTIPLQGIRIGDLGITAIPFEVLAEIGLEIKEKTPFGDTFTIELANDYHGYLPTPHQHELGGYETWMGTCKVQEDASVVIVDQLLAMLAELAGDKRDP